MKALVHRNELVALGNPGFIESVAKILPPFMLVELRGNPYMGQMETQTSSISYMAGEGVDGKKYYQPYRGVSRITGYELSHKDMMDEIYQTFKERTNTK